MAVVFRMFKIFCSLGAVGPLFGGLLAPVFPNPINIAVYFALFGVVYGIKQNPLNKKGDKRDVGRSFRNAFFVYCPSMVILYICILYMMCRGT